jgi:hypothetical protein
MEWERKQKTKKRLSLFYFEFCRLNQTLTVSVLFILFSSLAVEFEQSSENNEHSTDSSRTTLNASGKIRFFEKALGLVGDYVVLGGVEFVHIVLMHWGCKEGTLDNFLRVFWTAFIEWG